MIYDMMTTSPVCSVAGSGKHEIRLIISPAGNRRKGPRVVSLCKHLQHTGSVCQGESHSGIHCDVHTYRYLPVLVCANAGNTCQWVRVAHTVPPKVG